MNAHPASEDELVAWLRAQPVGTVLLDRDGRAWQLRQWSFASDRGHVANWAWYGANTRQVFDRFAEPRLRLLAEHGPFRVIALGTEGQAVVALAGPEADR